MSNILVPIDFSKTSDNAVDYAIELAIQIKSKLVVLQHVLQPVVVTDALYTINAEDVLAYKNDVEVKLQEYALMVKEKCNRSIVILTEIGAGNLENEVANCCLKKDIAFVIMGITGANELEAKLIGSNTLNVSESIENPLFIVPPQYKFKHISKALLLTDYENTNENLPMKAFTYLLDSLNPILDVVHIANAPKIDSFEASVEKFELKNLLEKYSPTFKVKYSDDFVFAVNEMVLENNYQLLICISQQKNWLQKFLGKSHTHQLAFNAKVPLLILHK
jgi:nucleotide-binding universal stress UspA family protein